MRAILATPSLSRRPGRLAPAWLATFLLAVCLAIPSLAGAEPFRLIVTELSTPLLPNSVMELAKS